MRVTWSWAGGAAPPGLLGGSQSLAQSRAQRRLSEVVCIILGGGTPGALCADFEQDLTRAQQVDPQRWGERDLRQRVAEQATRIPGRFL
jgi:hypothetical protein